MIYSLISHFPFEGVLYCNSTFWRGISCITKRMFALICYIVFSKVTFSKKEPFVHAKRLSKKECFLLKLSFLIVYFPVVLNFFPPLFICSITFLSLQLLKKKHDVLYTNIILPGEKEWYILMYLNLLTFTTFPTGFCVLFQI